MTNNQVTFITDLFENGPMVVFKWMAVVGLVMYAFFAAVILKQVGIMTESVEADANGVVTLFAWVHLLMAIGLVFIAIAVL